MNNIKKINLFANTIEEITVFDSELTRKIESMGLNVSDVLIKINSEVPKGKKEETELAESKVRAQLRHMCAEGYVLDGRTYMPFLAGSSDARKATSSWIDVDLLPELGKWALCGLQTKDMVIAVNKYMAYLGLLTSASKSFEEAFDSVIDIRRVAIIPDTFVDVFAKADIVTMRSVEHDANRVCNINAFDGFGIIRAELTNNESCTLRGPWLKAYVQAALFDKIAAFCRKNNIPESFKDFWGNTINLADVDVILTESCFKAAKLYKSWTQYQEAFELMGHTICVCVREHSPKLKGMPYQQGQTLSGNEEDALHFANHAYGTVYKYHEAKNAACLLSGDHRAAAKLYPALLNELHTSKCIQEKYTSKREDMLGGRIPELGYNAFLAPDMMAFVQHLLGQKITGSLKAGECSCAPADKGDVDVTRSPHLDNAHVVLNNVRKMSFVPTKTPTMFINIFDMTTIQLRADYDGDHVWYSQDEWLLGLIKKTSDTIHNLPADWDVDKAPKSPINRATIANFICNLLHGSEIGIYADSLTKMWNSSYDRDVCDWLTYAGNVLIDAAKHTSVKIVKPDAVKELSAIPLPEFARHAKATADCPATSKYWDEIREYTGTPRCAYSGSFLDMYSRKVGETVPETLTINGVEELVFDPTFMMVKADRKVIPGLCKRGTWNPEKGTFEDAGVFQQIAFRHSDEWKLAMNSDAAKMHRDEWEAAKKAEAQKEIISYCRTLYGAAVASKTDDEILIGAYDNVLRNIFNTKMSEGMRTAVMQCFWRVFGDIAVRVLKSKVVNLDSDFIDPEFDDDDDLFDVSDC